MTTDNAFEFIPFTANDWSLFAGATQFADGSQPLSCPLYVEMQFDGETYDAIVIIDQPNKLDRPGDHPSQTTGELYFVTVHICDDDFNNASDSGVFTYTCDASWFTPLQFKTKMEVLFMKMADDTDMDDAILVTSQKLLALGFHFTK